MVLQYRRQVEFSNVRDAHRDDAQDDADVAALLEDVAAEAAEAGHAVGEVELRASLKRWRWLADMMVAAIVTRASWSSRMSVLSGRQLSR